MVNFSHVIAPSARSNILPWAPHLLTKIFSSPNNDRPRQEISRDKHGKHRIRVPLQLCGIAQFNYLATERFARGIVGVYRIRNWDGCKSWSWIVSIWLFTQRAMTYKQLHGQLLLGVVFVSHAFNEYAADILHHLNRSAEQIVCPNVYIFCFDNETRIWNTMQETSRREIFFDAAGCRYNQTPVCSLFLNRIVFISFVLNKFCAMLALQLRATTIAKSVHWIIFCRTPYGQNTWARASCYSSFRQNVCVFSQWTWVFGELNQNRWKWMQTHSNIKDHDLRRCAFTANNRNAHTKISLSRYGCIKNYVDLQCIDCNRLCFWRGYS